MVYNRNIIIVIVDMVLHNDWQLWTNIEVNILFIK